VAIFERNGGVIETFPPAALEVGEFSIPLLELHPRVDHIVLPFEKEEGLERFKRFSEFLLTHKLIIIDARTVLRRSEGDK
jgi:hypothetical protein